jgi:hypothetical protein
MANYAQIYKSFWTDPKIGDDFTPEDKYFYLYLLTNPCNNITGCFEISFTAMERETGYNRDTVSHLLKRMEETHKVIRFSQKTKEVLLVNWWKYNWTKSPKLASGVIEKADEIKSPEFKAYVLKTLTFANGKTEKKRYPMDTLSEIAVDVSVDVDVSDSVTDTVSDTDPTSKVKPEKQKKSPLSASVQKQVIDAWNGLGLKKVTRIVRDTNRFKWLERRIEEYGLEAVLQAIANVGESKFLQGHNDRGWTITFDWFVRPNNFPKVLEGNYSDKSKRRPALPDYSTEEGETL